MTVYVWTGVFKGDDRIIDLKECCVGHRTRAEEVEARGGGNMVVVIVVCSGGGGEEQAKEWERTGRGG